jgi:hypothetical protein
MNLQREDIHPLQDTCPYLISYRSDGDGGMFRNGFMKGNGRV